MSAPAPAPRIQTNRTAPGPRSGLGIWLDQHLYSFVSSLGRALRRPWSTALTIGVMAVAFALPLGLWLALVNVQHLAGTVQASRQIDVFLKTDTSAARARRWPRWARRS